MTNTPSGRSVVIIVGTLMTSRVTWISRGSLNPSRAMVSVTVLPLGPRIYFQYSIAALYSGLFRGTSFEWRNDDKYLVAHRNFHTHALESSTQILGKLFAFCRRQEICVRVTQRFSEPLHHSPNTYLIRFFR